MKIEVDRERCEGHALCVMAVPEVFDVTEEGVLVVLVDHPDAAIRGDLDHAAASCPTRALTVHDDNDR